MLPNEQHPQRQGADSVWPPTMFHPRSTGRSTPVPQAVQPSTNHVQRLINLYGEILGDKHCNPDEEIQWVLDNFSADDLVMIGHIYLALAQWKPNEPKETPGVTRVTPDGAGDSGAEFPGCNSVTEFPETPKMPYLAPIGRGN